jgi:hypothetical protein
MKKTIFNSFRLAWIALIMLLFIMSKSYAQDTCMVNDQCVDATLMPPISSDVSFVCIDGCNLYAAPDDIFQDCQMGDYPTVWYKLTTDDLAQVMNIEVYSADVEAPIISLFSSFLGCDHLVPVYLSGNSTCIIGAEGLAKVIGIPVNSNINYYIAVSSLHSIGGNFELCVSTISTGSVCVKDRDIEVVARSNGGPLEGPYDPNETISICLNIHQFTAAGNGCQWFQGIVPVFGNGWDPASFDSLGQPINARINGVVMGELGNGLYGASTWDWFKDVDYHYDHPSMTVADLDGNGTIDHCNSVYEINCPHMGLQGGCCGPCWIDMEGDLLPPGWFAYGINGSCSEPGPPVGVDWGDGNTCGDGMGPWRFCFDLITRNTPDCMTDSTKKDLTIGFSTFADGETGAWTGSASVCALDGPLKMSLKAKCGRVSSQPIETLPDLCSGDTLEYWIEAEGIDRWEWNISPFTAVPYLPNQGANGTMIQAPVINTTTEPMEVTAILIGYIDGSEDLLIRKFMFNLLDDATCGIVSTSTPISAEHSIDVRPVPAREEALVTWDFETSGASRIEVHDINGRLVVNHQLRAEKQFKLDTGDFLPGVYILSIVDGTMRKTTRMMKY